MYSIETTNLSFRFSAKESILNDINLRVPEGSIYGFLGPNGAGKTTTLKLILGLLKKQQGTVTVFNKPFEEHRIEILKQTGSLIEAPSLYGHLTARENLRVWQKIFQCPRQRMEDVLKIVGLAGTGNKKAGKFSLGMKQRLCIAIALLHRPKLLILDEPANGLDPRGIVEIRELLMKINKEEKITVVISSHQLSEIEKMVTHIGIINKGSLLFQGTLEELHLKQAQVSHIVFETNNSPKAMEVMRSNNFTPTLLNGHITIPNTDKKNIARLNAQLLNHDIEVYQIAHVKSDLESIFIGLTEN